ncbi:hemolysin XhlA family protein [Candidatus Woesearchaeota archaeon]|nr:hemolysin XhlA family protein [Candidatus Woesearchaeota archaeon]
MLRNFLKWVIIIGFILATWVYFTGSGNCQELSEQEKLLTEISVDVKYIKSSIGELKIDFKSIQSDLNLLEKRVTTVENKTTNLENVICNIEQINKWFLGILATIIGGLILYQYKRAGNFRKDDRA